MEYFYVFLFVGLVLVTVLLKFRSVSEELSTTSTLPDVDELKRFKVFRSNYLIVFCLMMGERIQQNPALPGMCNCPGLV